MNNLVNEQALEQIILYIDIAVYSLRFCDRTAGTKLSLLLNNKVSVNTSSIKRMIETYSVV